MDRLIGDKISSANWQQHIGASDSLFVNSATWSLLLTGKLFSSVTESRDHFTQTLKQLLSKPGMALTRPFILQGMKSLGNQFVMAPPIEKALPTCRKKQKHKVIAILMICSVKLPNRRRR